MSGIKFSNTTPAAPGGMALVTFQADSQGNISAAYTPGGGGFTLNGVNHQTGTSYTFVSGDNLKLVTFNNAAAVTANLPNANTLASTWAVFIANLGAGTVTLTPSVSTIDGAATLALTQNQGVVLFGDGTNYYTERGVGGGGGAGTVTSVGLAAPSQFGVAGSPVTSSGTITITWNNQSANAVLAGPTTGAAAAPTFRALVPADYPVFVASGASHAAGAVPDPGSTAGTTRFLREDATFAVPVSSAPIFAQTAKRFTLLMPNGTSNIAATPQVGDVCTTINSVWANNEAPTANRGLSTSYNSATTAVYTGLHTTVANYRGDANPQGAFDVYIARTTDIRAWIGFSANSTLTVSDTPTGAYAMFRFSSIAGDTHWKCVTSDGTTQNVVDSGITPDTGGHRFGIWYDTANSRVIFYIDGTQVGISSANIPPATTLMFFNIVANWVTAAINPIIGVACVQIQTDR